MKSFIGRLLEADEQGKLSAPASSVVDIFVSTKVENVIEQEKRRNGGRIIRSQQVSVIRKEKHFCIPPFLRFFCLILPFPVTIRG